MYDFEGKIDDLVKRLRELQDEYVGKELFIDSSIEYDYYCESGYSVFDVCYNEIEKRKKK
jgi:hypothetical protein